VAHRRAAIEKETRQRFTQMAAAGRASGRMANRLAFAANVNLDAIPAALVRDLRAAAKQAMEKSKVGPRKLRGDERG
jgi:hypothetical protein